MKPKCGAKTRQGGEPCKNAAGYKTPHVHIGRCYLHGGLNPIKHGRNSTVVRAQVEAEAARIAQEPDLLDLSREVAMLKALRGRLMDGWKETVDAAGLDQAAKFTDRVGAMVDRIEKLQANRGISLPTLNRMLEQYGLEVAAAVREVGLSESDATKFFEALERRWAVLKPDAWTVNTAGAQAGS